MLYFEQLGSFLRRSMVLLVDSQEELPEQHLFFLPPPLLLLRNLEISDPVVEASTAKK